MRQAYGVWVSSAAAIKLIFAKFIQESDRTRCFWEIATVRVRRTRASERFSSVATFSLAKMWKANECIHNRSIHHAHNFVVTVRSCVVFLLSVSCIFASSFQCKMPKEVTTKKANPSTSLWTMLYMLDSIACWCTYESMSMSNSIYYCPFHAFASTERDSIFLFDMCV